MTIGNVDDGAACVMVGWDIECVRKKKTKKHVNNIVNDASAHTHNNNNNNNNNNNTANNDDDDDAHDNDDDDDEFNIYVDDGLPHTLRLPADAYDRVKGEASGVYRNRYGVKIAKKIRTPKPYLRATG